MNFGRLAQHAARCGNRPYIHTYIHTYIHYIHIYIDNCQVRGVSLGPIKISNLHAIAVRVVEKNLENIRP